MNIVIAGSGYVGLVTAVCFSEIGHKVTCVDVDEQKILRMKSGRAPIFEPKLEELMNKNQERLSYTTDYESAYRKADVIFIGVGTPERKDGSANLSQVFTTCEQISQSIHSDSIVVIKSTVPVGTNDKIDRFFRDNLPTGIRVDVVSNPEFLSQGSAVNDTMRAHRIVLGVENKKVEEVMKAVYDAFSIPYVITDRRSAEMIKYASNDFLALKISYINEIANFCEIVDADIDDVALGMGMDPRIGDKFLKAGVGYGGSCFPKDTKALHWLASYHDHELKTIKAAIEVNENQKLRLLKKARKYFRSFSNVNVAVLGLAFKPGTDDLRDAPSLANIPILIEDGANISAWDPAGADNFKKIYPNEIRYCNTIDDALKGADLCFIFTEWDEIINYDICSFIKLMRRAIIIDGRNCYPTEMFCGTGIIYESIGRRISK